MIDASSRSGYRLGFALLPALLTALLAAACSDGSPPSDDGTPAGSPRMDLTKPHAELDRTARKLTRNAEFCRERWQILCNAWRDCGEAAASFRTTFTGIGDCIARGTEQCVRYPAVDEVKGFTQTADEVGVRALACSTAMRALPVCDVFREMLMGQNSVEVPECAPLPGSFDADEPCFFGDQCKTGYCKYDAYCSRCAARLGEGGACTANADCRSGFACSAARCTAYVGSGGACGPERGCLPGLACTGGVCSPLLALGAACDVTAPNACDGGYCRAGRCEELTFGAAPGERCGADPETGVVRLCGPESSCRYAIADRGVCQPRSRAGGVCSSGSREASECEVFSSCVEGMCSVSPAPACHLYDSTVVRDDDDQTRPRVTLPTRPVPGAGMSEGL